MHSSPNASEKPWDSMKEVGISPVRKLEQGLEMLDFLRKGRELNLMGELRDFQEWFLLYTLFILTSQKILSEKPDLKVSEYYLLSRPWLVRLTFPLQTLGSLKFSPTSWYLNFLLGGTIISIIWRRLILCEKWEEGRGKNKCLKYLWRCSSLGWSVMSQDGRDSSHFESPQFDQRHS